MSLDPVTALLDIGGKVIDRIWPDPVQAASAKGIATVINTKNDFIDGSQLSNRRLACEPHDGQQASFIVAR